MNWAADKRWADQFMPEVKSRLGRALLREGTWHEDAQEATDLIVLEMAPIRVACRVRRQDCLRYEGEFTVRCSRPKGIRTEYQKIAYDGFGTHMFYGIAGQESPKPRLQAWMILDLEVFRAAEHWAGKHLKSNGDASSDFYVYSVYLFPPELVIERRCLIPSQPSLRFA